MRKAGEVNEFYCDKLLSVVICSKVSWIIDNFLKECVFIQTAG